MQGRRRKVADARGRLSRRPAVSPATAGPVCGARPEPRADRAREHERAAIKPMAKPLGCCVAAGRLAEDVAGGRAAGPARVVRAFATITPQRGQAVSVTAVWPQRGQSMGGFMGANGNSRDEVPSMTVRAVEATAPTRIDLAGGTLDIWPLYLFHPGAVTVNAAIDRRAWCGVETNHEGVRIESKDTPRKAEGRNVYEVLGGELAGRQHPARPQSRRA